VRNDFFEFSGARSPIFLNFLPRTARDRGEVHSKTGALRKTARAEVSEDLKESATSCGAAGKLLAKRKAGETYTTGGKRLRTK
jgi:hypothetical protein